MVTGENSIQFDDLPLLELVRVKQVLGWICRQNFCLGGNSDLSRNVKHIRCIYNLID